jgi:hypothetical protein
MSAPLKPLLALGIAFAAGVGVTAAFVGTEPDQATAQQGMVNSKPRAVVTSNAEKVASLATSPRSPGSSSASEVGSQSGTNGWVDPVKPRSVTSPSHQPLLPLVFHVDDNRAPSRAGASPERGQAGKEPDQRSVVAMVSPPPRPEKAELVAKPALPARPQVNHHPAVAVVTTDRTLLSRRVAEAPSHKSQAPKLMAKLHRRPEPVRVASMVERPGEQDVVEDRNVRRTYVLRQEYDDTPPQFYLPRRTRYTGPYDLEADYAPREYRQRTTSAESDGLMRWLERR